MKELECGSIEEMTEGQKQRVTGFFAFRLEGFTEEEVHRLSRTKQFMEDVISLGLSVGAKQIVIRAEARDD
ncbi:MAG: hypothetical protein WBW94_10630 [Anaerolineales bacterium]